MSLPQLTSLSTSALALGALALAVGVFGACDSEDSGGSAPTTCEVGDSTYEVGDSFSASDGCNTCQCEEDGLTSCTTLACEEPTCGEDDCGPAMGMPNYLCDDGVTMAGPGACELQADGSCGWGMTSCPYAPCQDKACGDACSACAPDDDECVETAEEKACNLDGVCEGSFDVSQCVATRLDPCDGKVCGEECVNSPNDPMNGTMSCDDAGQCVLNDEFEGCDGAPDCEADDACGPALGMPNYLCDDGVTTAGPGPCVLQEDGACGWTIVTCPEDSDTCESDADCAETDFCDFPSDMCGVGGEQGACVEKPQTCISGGPGACGCDGHFTTNDCELNAKGTDSMKFGGCQGFDPVALFSCGDIECNIETEYCSIALNDAVGPDEPEFYFSCGELPTDCPPCLSGSGRRG